MALSATLFSCSSSDSDDNTEIPQFAMTAKINGATFQANNPYGTNELSGTTLYNYYPEEDYIMLQGRMGGVVGSTEIDLWLKKSDIAVGTYAIGQETFDTPPSHFIDLIDNSNDIFENTKSGTIVITEVNTTTHIVKGTFQFSTVEELDNPAAPIDINVTEGTFRYTYQ